jgi:RNA methyltransferase, TrmH family
VSPYLDSDPICIEAERLRTPFPLYCSLRWNRRKFVRKLSFPRLAGGKPARSGCGYNRHEILPMKLSTQVSPRRIESRQNARVKELRAALQRGMRIRHGQIAIEGEHLVREAVRSGLKVRTLFLTRATEDLWRDRAWEDAEVLLLSEDVFSSAASTEHPQGIAALIDPPQWRLEHMLRGVPLLVIAAALQDPGNLGALIRSAEAFGASGMILLPGTVSLWNAKTLRASSGSAFRLPILAMQASEAFSALRGSGVRLAAAVAREGSTQPDFAGPVALLVGNEGAGVPEAWLAEADARVTIPCPGPVESLNAAVAGSVLLYEAARQRQARSSGSHARQLRHSKIEV